MGTKQTKGAGQRRSVAQIVVRIPEDLAGWLEAEHPGRGDVSELVRRLLTAERLNGSRIESVEGSPVRSGQAERAEPELPTPAESPPDLSKKAKACAHSETTFKMGARYCVKCGEFV